MKIEFSEISMIEIESFYNLLLNDITTFKENIYTLDFSEVETLSLPAIQILISLKKYCDNESIQLESININSATILQSLEIYNLKNILGVKS